MTIGLGERTWDLPYDFDIGPTRKKFHSATLVKRLRFKEGLLIYLEFPEHSRVYISTRIFDGDGCAFIEGITPEDWDKIWAPYILEDLDKTYLIDLKGDFDGDDIELAQMFIEGEMK